MARPLRFLPAGIAATALLLAMATAQRQPHDMTDDDKTGAGLKRKQIEEILKSDRVKSIEDAGQMMKLSEELKGELEKNDKSVLSVAALRKAEEIEKLAKRIRGRLRRY
jgi:hypothetical protein